MHHRKVSMMDYLSSYYPFMMDEIALLLSEPPAELAKHKILFVYWNFDPRYDPDLQFVQWWEEQLCDTVFDAYIEPVPMRKWPENTMGRLMRFRQPDERARVSVEQHATANSEIFPAPTPYPPPEHAH